MSVLKLSLLVLLCSTVRVSSSLKSSSIDVCSIWSETWKTSTELKRHIYSNVKPAAGNNAGKYSKVKVNSWYECVAQCCQFDRCNVAYWISDTCLHVECISDELCQPISGDNNDLGEDTLYLSVRSVQSTAASIDYEDPGRDQCNATKPCPVNEKCSQVSINAQLKRSVCSCDRDSGYRRINGVCREYSSRTKPCALYEKDFDYGEEPAEDDNRGLCRKNEECLPPSDRAKHGYCQCKLGFVHQKETGKCVADEQNSQTSLSIPSSSESTSTSSDFEFEVQAGEDRTVTLPTSQIDLSGRLVFKSNKSEVNAATINSRSWTLSWSLKSSTNGGKADLSRRDDLPSRVTAKRLQEGIYEFELQLNDNQGAKLASDVVKVEVISEPTKTPSLLVKVVSPVTVRLPQRTTVLQAHVEPSSRQVTYQWTYMKDGPVTPRLENADTSDLSVSNLRPGSYSFQLRVVDTLGNEQVKKVQLSATGEPIKAQVSTAREIVFWPSNDVVLDATSSIVESDTQILWSLLPDDRGHQKQTEIDIVSPRALKTRVTNLRIGQYKFQLTLTTDDQQYISKVEVPVIVYSQDGRPPKIQIDLQTPTVNILNNLVILNASGTTADYGITKWLWSKSPSSPAMGHFLNNSNHFPIAYVTNLIEGQYVFHLQVVDDRQQMSEMNVSVRVDGIAEAENLVEILFPSKPDLRQQTLDNLLSQIRVFLIDVYPNIYIDMVGVTKDNVLLIKGRDAKSNSILPPKSIADHLRAKLKSLRSASNVNILSVNTYLCLSNCSNHGTCDRETKRCVCNRYYMANWFKSMVQQEPNCDFLIHYFALITTAGSIATLLFCWLCLCCCLRCRRRRYLLQRRKRIRYQLLHENDDDDDDEQISPQSPSGFVEKSKSKFRLFKKGKSGKGSAMIVSESDYELSDENGEQTLYDKPLLAAKSQTNPSGKKSRGLKVPIQDSNGSPMLRNNGQSPTNTDNSVA